MNLKPWSFISPINVTNCKKKNEWIKLRLTKYSFFLICLLCFHYDIKCLLAFKSRLVWVHRKTTDSDYSCAILTSWPRLILCMNNTVLRKHCYIHVREKCKYRSVYQIKTANVICINTNSTKNLGYITGYLSCPVNHWQYKSIMSTESCHQVMIYHHCPWYNVWFCNCTWLIVHLSLMTVNE